MKLTLDEKQPPATVQADWFSGIVSQKTLLLLLTFPCACLSFFCLVILTGSGCPVDDLFFRGLLQVKPAVSLPDRTITQGVDGAEGSHGGWSGGLYSADHSPQEVLDFYYQIGSHCSVADSTVYDLGGFRLNIQAPYWNCDVPAKPWSRGTVAVLPEVGYVNALRLIYRNPPPLFGGVAISGTIIGSQLRQFYGPDFLHGTNGPAGGTVLRTYVGWCSP